MLHGAFLARQKGFEPPAFPLGGGRSILLSYWRINQMKLQAELYSKTRPTARRRWPARQGQHSAPVARSRPARRPSNHNHAPHICDKFAHQSRPLPHTCKPDSKKDAELTKKRQSKSTKWTYFVDMPKTNVKTIHKLFKFDLKTS